MKSDIYVLYHIHPEDERYDEDWKLIGIYDDEAKATAAIADLRGVAGFRDYPDEFRIITHRINDTSWKDGYVRS